MSDEPDASTDSGESGHRDSLPTRREPAVGAEDSRVGAVFDDRYRIQKRIGAGGMGVVYRAVHESLDRTVVIKVLTEEKLKDSVSVQRFEREAKSLSRLDHSNIVTVYDFGSEGNQPYLAMEHVDGIELRAMLDEGESMDLPLFSSIASQILDGMAHAHRKGLVHRDLKPSNIMLTEREQNPYFVKLLDFGLAKLASGDVDVTAENRVVGSMAYLAPEQITGSSVDQRADVYSLGIVFYWMLTGRKPFRGSRASIVYDQIHSDPPPLPLQLPADSGVPEELVGLIQRCLSKDPVDRPRSAADLQAQLQESTDELPAEEIPTNELDQPTEREARDEAPSSRSRRETPSGRQSRETARQWSASEASGPVEPGTESSEIVDEHQTDDRAQPFPPDGDADMSMQEAFNSAQESAETEERTDEPTEAPPGRGSWVAIGMGAAFALAILGIGGWFLAAGGSDDASTAAQKKASSSGSEQDVRRELGRVEEMIEEGQFEAAAGRLDELESEADSASRNAALQKWRDRLKANRLYARARRQRENGKIGSAMSTYAELVEIDPDFEDAAEKLESLKAYGLLKVETDASATVEVDDEIVGEGPISQLVAPGNHEILVTGDTGTSWTKTVEVDENETVSLAPVLGEDRPAGAAGGTVPEPAADRESQRAAGASESTGATAEAGSDGGGSQSTADEAGDETGGADPSTASTGGDEGQQAATNQGDESASGDVPVGTDESGGTKLLDPSEQSEESAPAETSSDETASESEDKSETELLPVQ